MSALRISHHIDLTGRAHTLVPPSAVSVSQPRPARETTATIRPAVRVGKHDMPYVRQTPQKLMAKGLLWVDVTILSTSPYTL